ncbi:hypothetical protein ABTX64_41675, partial [Streptomyces sp900116325]
MDTTTAQQLQHIATLWPDLQDALGAPTITDGFGKGLRAYLRAIEEYDPEDRIALRPLERSPEQIGIRPVPISLTVHETMRTVGSVLHATATQLAADITRAPIPMPPPRRAAHART